MTNKQIEEGTSFAPRFDANGLISAIAADETSGEILMLAHMIEPDALLEQARIMEDAGAQTSFVVDDTALNVS